MTIDSADPRKFLPDELDEDRLAQAALAILSLTLHEGRVWKGLDWDLMAALHARGWISDPKGKAKSVCLTADGLRLAPVFLRAHFGRRATARSRANHRTTDAAVAPASVTHVVRCTKKLLASLSARPAQVVEAPTGVLAHWYANLLTCRRRRYVLFTHPLSLFSFVVAFSTRLGSPGFADLFRSGLLSTLDACGIEFDGANELRTGTPGLLLSTAQDRRVLGSMTDIAFQAKVRLESLDQITPEDTRELNVDLNENPLKVISYNCATEVLRKLLRGSPLNP